MNVLAKLEGAVLTELRKMVPDTPEVFWVVTSSAVAGRFNVVRQRSNKKKLVSGKFEFDFDEVRRAGRRGQLGKLVRSGIAKLATEAFNLESKAA